MSDMKDKLRKATLLLLFPLLLSSTGCLTWQPVTGLPLPAKVAEQVLDHPSTTIRIVAPGVPRLEVASPLIENDQLVGVVGRQMFSVPLDDITMLEIRKLSLGRTLKNAGLGYLGLAVVVLAVCVTDSSCLEG